MCKFCPCITLNKNNHAGTNIKLVVDFEWDMKIKLNLAKRL